MKIIHGLINHGLTVHIYNICLLNNHIARYCTLPRNDWTSAYCILLPMESKKRKRIWKGLPWSRFMTTGMRKSWAHQPRESKTKPDIADLVGGIPTPMKNISQFGWIFPIYGKIKNVPNHQPVNQWLIHDSRFIGYFWANYNDLTVRPKPIDDGE